MARQDAVLYVKKCRSEGFEDDLIRSELQKAGWPDHEIDLALVESRALSQQPPESPVVTPAAGLPPAGISRFSQIAAQKIKERISRERHPAPELEKEPAALAERPIEIEPAAAEETPMAEQKLEPLLIEPKPLEPVPVSSSPVEVPAGTQGSMEEEVPVAINKSPEQAVVPTETSEPKQEDFLPKLSKEGVPPIPGRAPSFGQENILTNLIKEKQAGVEMHARPIYQNYAKRRSVLGRVLIAAGLLIAVTVPAGGYWYYRTALYPQWLLSKSLASLADSASYQFDVDAKMTLKDTPKNISRAIEPMVPRLGALALQAFAATNDQTEQEESSFAISFGARATGAVDFHDSANPKQRVAVTIDGLGPFLPEDIGFEARSIGRVYYFQFTDLPSLSAFGSTPSTFPFDTTAIEKQWVKIDLERVAGTISDYQGRLGELDPSLGMYASSASDLSAASVTEDEMRTLMKQTFDAIEWSDAVSAEQLAGGNAYRYQGTMPARSLQEIMASALGSAGLSSDDASRKAFEELFRSLGDVETNVWISKDTEEVAQMSFTTSVPFPDPAMNGVLEYVVVARFSNINGTVAIDVPADAQDIASLLDAHFDELAEGVRASRASARDTQRVSDLLMIASMLDVYYEKNKTYPVSLDTLYPEYLVEIPTDPMTRKHYAYRRISARQFQLSAAFEDQTNPMLKSDSKPGDKFYDIIRKK